MYGTLFFTLMTRQNNNGINMMAEYSPVFIVEYYMDFRENTFKNLMDVLEVFREKYLAFADLLYFFLVL